MRLAAHLHAAAVDVADAAEQGEQRGQLDEVHAGEGRARLLEQPVARRERVAASMRRQKDANSSCSSRETRSAPRSSLRTRTCSAVIASSMSGRASFWRASSACGGRRRR